VRRKRIVRSCGGFGGLHHLSILDNRRRASVASRSDPPDARYLAPAPSPARCESRSRIRNSP